jgi:hypothetical protein
VHKNILKILLRIRQPFFLRLFWFFKFLLFSSLSFSWSNSDLSSASNLRHQRTNCGCHENRNHLNWKRDSHYTTMLRGTFEHNFHCFDCHDQHPSLWTSYHFDSTRSRQRYLYQIVANTSRFYGYKAHENFLQLTWGSEMVISICSQK